MTHNFHFKKGDCFIYKGLQSVGCFGSYSRAEQCEASLCILTILIVIFNHQHDKT